ncbi:hypothetical protein ACFL6I_24550, partial [candidate division KSB1 bacterium]
TLLYTVAIVIVAFIGYSMFFDGGSNGSVLTSQSASVRGGGDNELLLILVNLRSITLDDALFRDPAFMNLVDFGQQLVPEPTGRQNPFAPVGSDSI